MPDLNWLGHNLRAAWSYSLGPGDFARQMLLRYSGRLPPPMRRPHWRIGVRCPPPLGNVKLVLRDNIGADLYIYSEVIEHECYDIPVNKPPETILDLGANIGLSAVYFARRFPAARIACVEPVADNVAVLRENLALNGVAAAVFPAAAHVGDGTVKMALSKLDYGHVVADDRDAGADDVREVAALTVPSILAQLGWDRVSLLKLDVEGHETTLLSEACDWLHRVDAICLEYHLDGGADHLASVARRYHFLPPRELPNRLWFLSRSA